MEAIFSREFTEKEELNEQEPVYKNNVDDRQLSETNEDESEKDNSIVSIKEKESSAPLDVEDSIESLLEQLSSTNTNVIALIDTLKQIHIQPTDSVSDELLKKERIKIKKAERLEANANFNAFLSKCRGLIGSALTITQSSNVNMAALKDRLNEMNDLCDKYKIE